jgi:uncharacterized protein with PIN domain
MIVVDSSALCAVFFNEPEKSAFQAILAMSVALSASPTGGCILSRDD